MWLQCQHGLGGNFPVDPYTIGWFFKLHGLINNRILDMLGQIANPIAKVDPVPYYIYYSICACLCL